MADGGVTYPAKQGGIQQLVPWPHDDLTVPTKGFGPCGNAAFDDKNASEWQRYSTAWIIYVISAGQAVLPKNANINLWEAGGANVSGPGTGASAFGSNIPYGQSLVETDAQDQGAVVTEDFRFLVDAIGFEVLTPFLVTTPVASATQKQYDPTADFYMERLLRVTADNLAASIVFKQSSCNSIAGRVSNYPSHSGVVGGTKPAIGRGDGVANIFPLRRQSMWGAVFNTDKPVLQLSSTNIDVAVNQDAVLPFPTGVSIVVPVVGLAYGQRIYKCRPQCTSTDDVVPA